MRKLTRDCSGRLARSGDTLVRRRGLAAPRRDAAASSHHQRHIVQLGLATMPLCEAIASSFTLATTSGTLTSTETPTSYR